MAVQENNFELNYTDGTVRVQRHSIGAQVIFRVTFSNKRAPLVITRAAHSFADKFWTSIPEGRQKEAEEVGALISEYFKSFQ
jgi:hypothetical protein